MKVGLRQGAVYGKQAQYLRSNEFTTGFVAGRGGGKTHVGAVKVVVSAKNGEPWMAVSPDSGVIKETTLPTFLDVCRQYGRYISHVQSPYPKVVFRTNDGGVANIVMRSGEKPDKLRGPNKAGLWLDEASVMSQDVFNVGIAVLRHKGAMGKCFMTFTPRGRSHWTFEKFYKPISDYEVEDYSDKDVEYFTGSPYVRADRSNLISATSYENPFLPPEFAETIESQYTSLFAKQEIYGQFVDVAGLLFNRSDFQFIDSDKIPVQGSRVRYWDRASTEDGGAYTVGVLMLRDRQNRFIIENVVRGQWSPLVRREKMLATAQIDRLKYDNSVVIYCEVEGGSGGKEQMQQDVMMLAGFPVYGDKVSGVKFKRKDGLVLPGSGKIVRATPLSAMVENQNVFLARASWNRAYLDELIAFPHSKYADQVDASSGAFNKLAFRGVHNVSSPEIMKFDEIHSQANKILAMQEEIHKRGDSSKTSMYPLDRFKR